MQLISSITDPRRVVAGLVALVVVVAAAVAGAAAPAAADDGPAPPAKTYRVLQDLHTDAVSTFLDDGVFALGSKADVPEGLGTRFGADEVWFHVDQDSQVTVPAGFEFIAPAGSQVWIAPESNPGPMQLWPGFSTESVPVGGIDNDRTLLKITAFDGPGDLELFTSAGLGQFNRLWSTDEGMSQFEVGRTHMHANWAFTQAGTYKITVEATATRSGTPVAASATYTFVVGDLPPTVATTTALSASAAQVEVGQNVTFTATVAPGTVSGFVEFRDGVTVLGHQALSGGQAVFSTATLGIGSHAVTAHYVPAVTNLATASASTPVTVTVTQPGGVPFGISGIQESYQPGATLNATAVGYTLGEGQQYRWLRRPVGSTATGSNVQTSTSAAYSQAVTASEDGYELSVTIRQGNTVLAQTPWVTINVEQDGERPQLARTLGEGAVWPGDAVRLEASGLNLEEGESIQFVRRSATALWSATGSGIMNAYSFTYPDQHILEGVRITRATSTEFQFAVRVVRDGIAVRQSEPVTLGSGVPEIMIDGLQGLYMGGTTADLSAIVYPAREGNDLIYQWQFSKISNFNLSHPSTTVWREGTELPLTVQQQLNVADHDQGYLRVQVLRPGWTDTLWNDSVVTQSGAVRIYVTDDPDAQLFFFNNLSAHYHQGDNVNLTLTVAPEPQAGDEIVWEWNWPGIDDWLPFPGVSGSQVKQYTLTAEQALHGVQVRATLDFASDRESIVTTPVTIEVDDHGAAARQRPTIGGDTSVADGDTVTLTRELPSNGATVLTHHRWEKQLAGGEWTVVEGVTGPTLSFPVALADDGAQFRVSLVKPNGDVGYGPSPAVALTVSGSSDDPLSQTITATLDPDAGALVVTADPDDRTVVMDPFALGSSGDRWVSQGSLRPVTVTDTRAARPGWNVSGQVSAFTSPDDSFEGRHLGWSPSVTSQSDGQGVAPGAVVPPGFTSGNGISSGATLATAPSGSGIGTAVLGAGLVLDVPTDITPGTYTALLTLTAI